MEDQDVLDFQCAHYLLSWLPVLAVFIGADMEREVDAFLRHTLPGNSLFLNEKEIQHFPDLKNAYKTDIMEKKGSVTSSNARRFPKDICIVSLIRGHISHNICRILK